MGILQKKCKTTGCKNKQVLANTNYNGVLGQRYYRPWCNDCHNKRTGAKHGLKSVGEVVAKNAGFDSVLDYAHSIHPYLKHRKNYCENIDGRLSFTCTTNVFWTGMLDVDHKNGNPTDHRKRNLQTLCKCCHAYKTNKEKDYNTPGRKALGVKH